MQLIVLRSKRLKPKRPPGFYLILSYKNLENQKETIEIRFDENCSIAKKHMGILYAALYTTPDTGMKVEYQYLEKLYSTLPDCDECKLRQQSKPNSPPCGLYLDHETVQIKQMRSITIQHFETEPAAVRILWEPSDVQQVCNMIEFERLRNRNYYFERRISSEHSYTSDPIEFTLSADVPYEELEQRYINKVKQENL